MADEPQNPEENEPSPGEESEQAPTPEAEAPAEEQPAAPEEQPAAPEEPAPAAEEPAPAPAAEEPAPAAEEPAPGCGRARSRCGGAARRCRPPRSPPRPPPRKRPRRRGPSRRSPAPTSRSTSFPRATTRSRARRRRPRPTTPKAPPISSETDEEDRPVPQAAIDLAAGARYGATGKRKTAIARVVLKPGKGEYLVNGRALEVHFPRPTLQRNIRQPLETVGYESRMDVVATLHGGGVSAQAGALRHGISRALIEADPNLRGELKRRGFLTRDPRVKERKKAGLKKARKRPQFSKR